jgi:hypothetical protein
MILMPSCGALFALLAYSSFFSKLKIDSLFQTKVIFDTIPSSKREIKGFDYFVARE